ncbi:hypothetical protein [Flavihumibacter sp. CACIAM 22H1]|uniref:hypothetical protein n=1 Tax=Flavihumibacter sp. CACIAM 22H1 TaxID=1812911 RepID=UPI0007A87070|nr:hypothetical protein [Flavihumibacter sp. CACIAM 22H1]KYP13127.1 MAG: hypothetical protein A1D16_20925 [Flavihumibacter sp. CACIAM 22H1]
MSQAISNQTELLVNNDFSSFLELYDEHGENLLLYAFLTLRDEAKARIAVRSAFVKLWQHPDRLLQGRSVYSVLFSEVKVMTYLLKTSDRR